jgi:hypothetical protein
MGPLVPDIITNELNLVVALLIGFGFGYILEQAGFSSSRKLTGLFYGTDFTVLRVFFTAGATAMAGVVLLAKLGLLDTNDIFINPTFVQSAIVGGLIMGVGFVLGGYCPGTSLCALSVGRVDALAFAVGSFLGVFAFGEAFPRIRGLYTAGSMGDLTVPAWLGVSPGVVVLATVIIALAAFGMVGRIERRVIGSNEPAVGTASRHRLWATGLLALGIVVAMLPSKQDRLLARASDAEYRKQHPVDTMTPDEIAFRILDNDPSLRIVDIRSPSVFTATGLPGAENLALSDFFSQSARELLHQPRKVVVFVGEDDASSVQAATLARELGVERVAALEGGYPAVRDTVLNVVPPADALTGPARDTWEFRVEAAPKLAALIKARSAAKPVVKKAKKIAGGCGV